MLLNVTNIISKAWYDHLISRERPTNPLTKFFMFQIKLLKGKKIGKGIIIFVAIQKIFLKIDGPSICAKKILWLMSKCSGIPSYILNVCSLRVLIFFPIKQRLWKIKITFKINFKNSASSPGFTTDFMNFCWKVSVVEITLTGLLYIARK